MTVTSASPQNTGLMRTLSVLRDVVLRPSGAIGLFLVVFHVVLALVSPWIVPYDYKAMNSAMMLTGPEAQLAAYLGPYQKKKMNMLKQSIKLF